MVPPDSPIERVEDLKGKSVATAKGASDTFTFEHFILPAHGLSVKDVRIINSTNTERLPMLRARNVDVILINEPTATIAEAQGYARNLVSDFCKYDVAAMMSIVHPKVVEERRLQVVNYIRAWLKAADYFRTSFDDYVKIYHAHEISMGVKVEPATTRAARSPRPRRLSTLCTCTRSPARMGRVARPMGRPYLIRMAPRARGRRATLWP